MKKYLALLAVLAFAVAVSAPLFGCATTHADRMQTVEAVCLSQCPIAYALLLEQCGRINQVEKPVYYQACMDEVEAARLACPLLCDQLYDEDAVDEVRE